MRIINDVYTVESLTYVRGMLVKYAHVWNKAAEKDKSPSRRMEKWAYYYTDAKDIAPDVWKQFCTGRNAILDHDAFDLMA